MRKILLVLVTLGIAGCAPAAVSPPTVAPSPQPSATATLSPEELISLAQDAANRGDWSGSILLLDLALQQDGENTQALLLRGNAYRELGELDQAISNYNQSLAINEEDSAVYYNRALAYIKLGDADAALEDLARAIEISPTFGSPYRTRAELQLAAGNTAAAALDLQIYITLIPNAPDRAEVEAKIADLQAQAVFGAGPEGLLFFDDFSDTKSGWYTNGDPANLGGYSGGGYYFKVSQKNAAVWAMPGRMFTDTRVDVIADKQSGDDNNTFGVMCRISNPSGTADFYMFVVSSDGFYGIAKHVVSQSPDLIIIDPANTPADQKGKLAFSSAIIQGDATNKITAICSGDRLALFVNDVKLEEVTDDALTRGQPGLFAGAYEEPPVSVLFDNFAVYYQPPQ